MNTHQRGIYQPLVENVPIYDLEDEEDEDAERSRLPLLIVAGLVVLAAFAGVVWLAYNQGVERGTAGTSRIIAPPEGPIRTEPAPSVNQNALADAQIYNTPATPEQTAQNSRLAPAAPVTPPAAITPPAGNTPRVRPATDVAPTPAAPPAPTPAPARPAATPPAVAQVAPPPPAPARPAAAPAPAPAIVAQAAPPPPAPAAAPPAARGFFLQLGAYENEMLAQSGWRTFQTRYSQIAGSLGQDIQRADLGARGIWYRLRAGPFADRASAVTACEKLKEIGGNCFVTAQ